MRDKEPGNLGWKGWEDFWGSILVGFIVFSIFILFIMPFGMWISDYWDGTWNRTQQGYVIEVEESKFPHLSMISFQDEKRIGITKHCIKSSLLERFKIAKNKGELITIEYGRGFLPIWQCSFFSDRVKNIK